MIVSFDFRLLFIINFIFVCELLFKEVSLTSKRLRKINFMFGLINNFKFENNTVIFDRFNFEIDKWA